MPGHKKQTANPFCPQSVFYDDPAFFILFFLLIPYSADSLLKLFARNHDLMVTSHALKPEIHAFPQYFPLPASARMRLL